MMYSDKVTILILEKDDPSTSPQGLTELWARADVVIQGGRILKNRFGEISK